MNDKTTLHTFRGQAFQVAVLRHELTGKVSVAILPSEGKQWAQLRFWDVECDTPAEATELAQLLRSAAALANYVDEGGPVEAWRIESRRPGAI